MVILDGLEEDEDEQQSARNDSHSRKKMRIRTNGLKRALVGAGGRILFYPTLLYNVVRYKLQPEFRWWDQIDQYLLLGAVPFRKDVLRLKRLGVCGVVTLNESFETLVPSSLYHAHGIEHLVIPIRDYIYAPSVADISRAVDFIHKNASCGKITYVHCKAGRGRSTTIVLCYLVEHKNMTPAGAFEYVLSIRPRVLLHSSQMKAVEEYSRLRGTKRPNSSSSSSEEAVLITNSDVEEFSRLQGARRVNSPSEEAVFITDSDVEGHEREMDRNDSVEEIGIASASVNGKPTVSRFSGLFKTLGFS